MTSHWKLSVPVSSVRVKACAIGVITCFPNPWKLPCFLVSSEIVKDAGKYLISARKGDTISFELSNPKLSVQFLGNEQELKIFGLKLLNVVNEVNNYAAI